MDEETKVCPFCAEHIRAAATICRFCNRDLAASHVENPTTPKPLRNCPDCGGRGELRGSCSECHGQGQIKCVNCDGRGTLSSQTGAERIKCNVCHGGRKVRCDRCGGSGKLPENCSTCGGCGQMTHEEFNAILEEREEEQQRWEEERPTREAEAQARQLAYEATRAKEAKQAAWKKRRGCVSNIILVLGLSLLAYIIWSRLIENMSANRHARPAKQPDVVSLPSALADKDTTRKGSREVRRAMPVSRPREVRRALPVSTPDAFSPRSQPSVAATRADPSYSVTNLPPGELLNVRSAPGMNSEIIATLPVGYMNVHTVGEPVMNDTTEWIQLDLGNHTGWVRKDYLKPN